MAQNYIDGYVTDIDYNNYGYYDGLNPLKTKLACLSSGIDFPTIKTACELGIGMGISINVHSATSHIKWYGNDINVNHITTANHIAENSKNEVNLYDNSFEEFLLREDLPQFDFIGLHGIWSWINKKNQNLILEFINKKLNIGGIVYVSYNTYPGWHYISPIRELLKLSSTNNNKNVKDSINFVDEVLKTNPKILEYYPILETKFEQMRSYCEYYLVHEYLNNQHDSIYVSEMFENMTKNKLSFICSSDPLESIDEYFLSEEQTNYLSNISDKALYESVRDMMINRQFRRDYWIKGCRKLSKDEQIQKLKNLKLILPIEKSTIQFNFSTIVFDITLHIESYNKILSYINSYEIFTIGELYDRLNDEIDFFSLMDKIKTLIGMEYLYEVIDDVTCETIIKTRNFNMFICDQTWYHNDYTYIASPLIGSAIQSEYTHRLFLSALYNNNTDKISILEYVKIKLSELNLNLIRSEDTESKNSNEILEEDWLSFEPLLPKFKALLII